MCALLRNESLKTGLMRALALALCLAAASSADAATLRLLSLRCLTTEDGERDEARLTVIVDAGQRYDYDRNMRRGDTWVLNRNYVFTNQVTVKLYDRDSPDPDDRLGTANLRSTPTRGIRTFVFNRDGAHYELRYRIDP